jgi:RNA polymerase sigma factor (sigma-70 family)
MATRQASQLLGHIRGLADGCALARLTDRELLARFTGQRDQAAFAALVRRHGPMVLRVCRGVLRDEHAADDAFQATFLVLTQKAGALRRQELLAAWLHGVAHRVAARARVEAARRRNREARAEPRTGPDPATEVSTRELCAALEEEVGRLPEKYRAPFFLCHVEGRTRDQAAGQLGYSVRTLQRLLERGRALLQARLGRRGVSLSAALVAATLARGTDAAAVPAALVAATIAACLPAAGGAVPAGPAALADGVLRRLPAARARLLAVLMLAAVTAGAALLASSAPAPQQGLPEKPLTPPRAGDRPARPDFPDDPLPSDALRRLGSARWRCPGGVRLAAFSPDGQLLAVEGDDGVARLWDVATGRELRSFGRKVHSHEEARDSCLAFSPDGKYLALPRRTWDVGLTLFEVSTGKPVRTFKLGERHKKHPSREHFTAAAFSPDGKAVVAGTKGHFAKVPRGPNSFAAVIAWDVASGQEVWHVELRPTTVAQLGFSPGGKFLAMTGESHVTVLDAATRKEVLRHNLSTGLFAFDAAGTALWHRPYIANAKSQKVVKTDLKTGKTLLQRELPPGPVVAGPGGRLLLLPVVGGSRELRDVITGRRLSALPRVPGPARVNNGPPEMLPLALAPDGKTLAAGVCLFGWQRLGYGRQYLTVSLFETATGRERHRLPGHREGVLRLAVSRDGRRIASAGPDETVCLWDRPGGKLLRTWKHPGRGVEVALAPDGKRVAGVSGGQVVLWDAVTGKESKRWRAADAPTGPDQLSHPLFTPDGKRLVLAEGYAQAEVWDPATGKRLALFKHAGQAQGGKVSHMALSPDGRLGVMAGNAEGCLWDVKTGKLVSRFTLYSTPRGLALAPDGKTLALADNLTVSFFRIEGDQVDTRKPVGSISVNGGVTALAFAPDGRVVATGTGWSRIGPGQPENLVQVWDVATGKERRRFSGHRDEVTAVAFTPDGRAVVSGSLDNTLLLWSVAER